jgi:hypothetical protein
MGDRTIRRLLVIGALSVIRWGRKKPEFEVSWIGKLVARKPLKLAAVALANKTARVMGDGDAGRRLSRGLRHLPGRHSTWRSDVHRR